MFQVHVYHQRSGNWVQTEEFRCKWFAKRFCKAVRMTKLYHAVIQWHTYI